MELCNLLGDDFLVDFFDSNHLYCWKVYIYIYANDMCIYIYIII